MNSTNGMVRGVFTALITPFSRDQKIDEDALRSLVEWQIDNGVQGLVPVGTTGESPTLDHEEHIRVIRIVIEQAKKRVPIIAGTGSNNTKEAIELTIKAKKVGADASLQVAPYYNKPSQEGMFQHFTHIAKETQLPQILYNIPGRSAKNIEVNTILKLAQNPLIIGVKDATGTLAQPMEIISNHIENFAVLSGDDALSLGIIAHGGDGVISVASNVIPKKMSSYINTALSGNITTARKEFFSLYPLFKASFIDSNPIPIKYMAHKIGLCEEIYRLPLCPLSQEHKTMVDTTLQNMQIPLTL